MGKPSVKRLRSQQQKVGNENCSNVTFSARHIFAAWWYPEEQQARQAVETSEQKTALFSAEFLNIIFCIFLQMTQSPCPSPLIPPNYHFKARIPAGMACFGVDLKPDKNVFTMYQWI